MSFLSYTKNFDENLLMLLLRDHQRYLPIIVFFDNMTRNLSELNWSEAELIAAEVSKANQSGFCTGIRGGISKALKTNPGKLENEKLKVILKFALKINQQADSITQIDIDNVVNVGWSEQTVEDIVGLVAIQKFYNVLATGLGFKELPEATFTEIGQDTVDKGGYVASFQQFVENSA